MKNRFCAAVLVCGSVLACAQTKGKSTASESEGAKLQGQIRRGRTKNIILFIGDGMGDSEITARATIKLAPVDDWLSTPPIHRKCYNVFTSRAIPSKPNYVTDSALVAQHGHWTEQQQKKKKKNPPPPPYRLFVNISQVAYHKDLYAP